MQQTEKIQISKQTENLVTKFHTGQQDSKRKTKIIQGAFNLFAANSLINREITNIHRKDVR